MVLNHSRNLAASTRKIHQYPVRSERLRLGRTYTIIRRFVEVAPDV